MAIPYLIPPAEMPLTRAEVAQHLEIYLPPDEAVEETALVSDAYTGTVMGPAVSVAGYSARMIVSLGAMAVDDQVLAKIQQSHNGTDWEDAGTFPVITSASANKSVGLDYSGDAAWIRLYAVCVGEPNVSALVELRPLAVEIGAYIDSLIGAATEHVQHVTGRQLVEATRTVRLDCFPCGVMFIPMPTLLEIVEVRYVDAAGNAATLDLDDFDVDSISEPGRLSPKYGKRWPVTHRTLNAVEVDFRCGYGTASDVPLSVKQAMLMLIRHWYERREAASEARLTPIPMAVHSLLSAVDVGTYA